MINDDVHLSVQGSALPRNDALAQHAPHLDSAGSNLSQYCKWLYSRLQSLVLLHFAVALPSASANVSDGAFAIAATVICVNGFAMAP